MSSLTYNSVALPYLLTRSIDYSPVYDDLAQQDYLRTRTSITVQSLVNAAPVGTQPPVFELSNVPGGRPQPIALPTLALPGETTSTQVMRRVEDQLNLPRKELIFTNNGQTLFQVKPEDDVMGGPFPRSVSVLQVNGSSNYIVQFTVEANTNDCPGLDPKKRPLYISNKWREQVTIDEDFYTRKVRTGKLVVRHGIDADSLRGVVCPPIEFGLKRVSSDYVIQEDGLALQYTFVDQEVYRQPPEPAVKWGGVYLTTQVEGNVRYGEFRVTLTGHKYTRKSDLVRSAVTIALARLRADGLSENKDGIAATVSVSEVLERNEITLSVRAKMNSYVSSNGTLTPQQAAALPPSATAGGTDVGRQFRLNLAQYDEQGYLGGRTTPDPGTRSTARLSLIAAALNDPCLEATVTNELTNQPPPPQPPPPTTPTTLTGIVPQIPAFLTSVLTGGPVGFTNTLTTGGTDSPPSQVSRNAGGQPRSAAAAPAATVQFVGTLSPGLPSGGPAVLPGGVYQDYQLRMRYKTNHNRAMLSLTAETGDGETAAFVATGKPTLQLRAEWTAERVGEPPAIPPSDLLDDNAVLLDEEIDPSQVVVTPGGQRLYRVSGAFLYGFRNPSKVNRSAAVPPWVADLERAAQLGQRVGDILQGIPEALQNTVLGTAVGALATLGQTVYDALTEQASTPAERVRGGIIDLGVNAEPPDTGGQG